MAREADAVGLIKVPNQRPHSNKLNFFRVFRRNPYIAPS
jgi:hypothetical protein